MTRTLVRWLTCHVRDRVHRGMTPVLAQIPGRTVGGIRAAVATGGSAAPTRSRVLVSYATGAWYTSLLRLRSSALRHGFTDLQTWRRSDLVSTPFYHRHQATLNQPRGGGFWLWKPYYILRALEQARSGDAVVYADAGVEFTADVEPIIDLCRQEGGVLLFAGHYDGLGAPGPNVNSRWTKRDCFIRMDADEPRVHGACQADASVLVFIRNERSLAFAREFLRSCEDPAILTDAPNIGGQPDLEGFIDHRHDQSVLSVLAVQHGITLHRHPSQYGNHLKEPAQRLPGEWCRLPYSDSPWPDRYETVLDHHRERSDRTPLVTAVEVASELADNRSALSKVPEWISDDVYRTSVFQYGLPERVRHLIDLDVGVEPTYADLLLHYARRLPQPVTYLEIGVSVGKTFFQMLQGLRSSHLVGFDLEDISPTLRAYLGPRAPSRDTWTNLAGSLRLAPSAIDRYPEAPRDHLVEYVSADIRDERAWMRLRGRAFNVVLSDAEHSPDAILHEAAMLERYDLLDPRGFVMVWDDLGDGMTDAFLEVWERLQVRFGLPDSSLRMGLARGWLGTQEPAHLVGLVANMPVDPRRESGT